MKMNYNAKTCSNPYFYNITMAFSSHRVTLCECLLRNQQSMSIKESRLHFYTVNYFDILKKIIIMQEEYENVFHKIIV